MSKWDGEFNGTYGSSRYSKRSLEDDLKDAMSGTYAWEGPNGELIRQSDNRLDVWSEGDGKGHYDHYYYNGHNDYGKAPRNRHD